jgi:4-amino-4-deoxy-L-arabinose transferase-like glycosyltransferase
LFGSGARMTPSSERYATWAYRSTLALVFLVYAIACLHGIANDWQWGHNGFNGAAFAQAARNSLRFNMVPQVQYFTDEFRPPREMTYTHHPLMLHFHLIALFRFLGDQPWVARIVPVGYSIVSQWLVFAIARRWIGRAGGLVAAATFALIPINLIFATMIDHEQGAIAWTLITLYAYFRWHETLSREWLVASLVGISVATQWDWSSYYVAFFMAMHAFFFRSGPPTPSRGLLRTHLYAFALSVVVLANAGAFFAFVLHQRGSLDEMLGSAKQRSSSPNGYWELVFERGERMHGKLLPALLAAFLAWYPVRLLTRRARLGELAIVFFALVQLVHSTVFKEAGFIHSYWVYFLAPAEALAVGVIAQNAFDLASRGVKAATWRASERLRSALVLGARAALVAVFVATAIPLTKTANEAIDWAFAKGFGAYVEPYDPQLYEAAWFRHITKRWHRGNAHFILSPNLGARIELRYYLDAPVDEQSRPTTSSLPPKREGRHRIWLSKEHSLNSIRTMARGHAVEIYDGSYVLIDFDSGTESLAAFKSREQKAPWWWRWLVHPTEPPRVWERDPRIETFRETLRPPA